jgi:Mrp family chromosome partitioning ATPase
MLPRKYKAEATFEKLLRLGPSEGMISYLRGEVELPQIIQRLGDDGLEVITAGGRANNDSVQMLSGQRMAGLLEKLKQQYDHVIIDTPPVVELADAGILGAMSDDVLLIARMNRTPRSLIEQAIRTLNSYNAPVAGLISTDQKRLRRRYYYYRYGYRYYYNYSGKEKTA